MRLPGGQLDSLVGPRAMLIASALAVAALAAAGSVALTLLASPSTSSQVFPVLREGVRHSSKSDLTGLVGLLELQTKVPAVLSSVSTRVVGIGAIGNTRVVLADTNVGYCLWRVDANMTCHSRTEQGELWVKLVAANGREQMVIAVPHGPATITATTSVGNTRLPVRDDLVFLDSTKVKTLILGPSGPVLAITHPGLKLHPGPKPSRRS